MDTKQQADMAELAVNEVILLIEGMIDSPDDWLEMCIGDYAERTAYDERDMLRERLMLAKTYDTPAALELDLGNEIDRRWHEIFEETQPQLITALEGVKALLQS